MRTNEIQGTGRPRPALAILCLILAFVSRRVDADNFSRVYFDARTDELVVTISYRGTNPDHAFSLRWGACKQSADGANQLDAEVLDSQARDAARQPFKTTTRFALTDIPCRPVSLTLRTAPRYLYTLQIPAATD